MSIYRPPPQPRKTVDLNGTAQQLEVKLSHEAALAVAYARRYLKNPGNGVDVLASGVVRRSLLLYMTHLGTLATQEQQRAEFMFVKSAANARAVDDDERAEAQDRLRSFGEGLPLPPFPEVLHGAAGLAQTAALVARVNAQVDEHMADLATTRAGRLLLNKAAGQRRKAAAALAKGPAGPSTNTKESIT